MEIKTLMIIIIFLLLVIYCHIININNKETFDAPNNLKSSNGVQSEFGYYKPTDILLDPLFSDMVVYNNDDNPYAPGQQSGIQKCIQKCPGRCVEFGVTGTAYCFSVNP